MAENASDRKELKASWKTEVEVPLMKLGDVAKHNTKEDIWMAIHGGVYNVTEYMRDHPGGPDALLEVAGTDATSAYEDVGHSEDAREIMHPFLVGHLEGASESESEPDRTLTISVVRSSAKNTEKRQRPNILLNPTVEVAIFATGIAALVHHARGLDPRSGTFLEGALVAVATVSAIGIASARYLSKHINLDVDFTKLPSHKPATNTVASVDYPTGVIAPSTYRKFALREKTELANGIFRFVFDLPKSSSVLGLPIGQHIAIRGTVDDSSVTRSYTPVSNNRDLGRLELLIRIYPDGHLGKYLKALQPGDKVDIRGPKGAMRYRKGMSKELGMVGGGTGITPLFQIIRAICEDKTDSTKVTLVFANRSEADIMLRKRLDSFAEASNGQFEVYYMLNDPPAGWKYGTGHIDQDVLQEKMPAVSDDNKVLVCGPPGLVNATKNNLVELGWKEPGSVSKMSDQIFCF